MLGIILKILAILGWFLLFVLILLLLLLLLAVVYPVSYRLWWEKDAEHMLIKAKASWLPGLLKVCYEYPVPGTVVVKLLGFKLYESGSAPKKEAESDNGTNSQTSKHQSEHISDHQSDHITADHAKAENCVSDDDAAKKETVEENCETETTADDPENGIITRIRNIINTIIAKFRQICDKIKHFQELAEYYIKLLKEEDTIQLFSGIITGSGNILKSIRPRKVKGQILLGTGSPDTTGYAMAVYGILSPYLGKNLLLTPDFEQKVLEGQLVVKGRIIIGVLLFNGLKVALDRRLRSFIKKWKREVI